MQNLGEHISSMNAETEGNTQTGFWLVVAGVALLALVISSFYSFVLFHTLAELGTLVVILSACSIALNSRHLLRNGYLLVLSVGFSGYAVIILHHMLAYKGVGIFNATADTPTQLWIAGRYLLAATFLVAGRYLDRPVRMMPLIAVCGVITGSLLLSIMYFRVFPVCFIEGTGLTPFKKASELVICIMFVLALADLLRQRQKLAPLVVRLVSAMLACFMSAELFFIFYVDVYGISNQLGHFANLAGFALYHHISVRIAVVDPYGLIFRELDRLNAELEKRVQKKTAQVFEASLFLRESQKVARVGAWKVNPETGFVYCTEEFYRLLDLPEDHQLDFEDSFDFIAPEYRSDLMENVMAAWRENRPFVSEYLVTSAAGKSFWAEIRCTGEFFNDQDQYICGTFQDITERKHVETTLIAARDAAESSNRAKQEFLGAISHELRTPLNGVLGGAQLLEMTALDDEQQQYLEIVFISAQRELKLVNDLLELTCIEAGSVTILNEPFVLREALEAVVQPLHAESDAKGLSLRLDFDERLPDVLTGDSGRLKQIVGVLLDNAIKFTGSGTISLALTVLEQEATVVTVGITVSDTGAGIPSAMLGTIFEPFVQADMSHTREYGGTGLGLAICRRLVELLKGKISVDSAVGQGSCFKLELPFGILPEEGEDTSGETAAANQPGRRFKVLVVEDDRLNQKVVCSLLQRLGHDVELAGDGAQGLECWRKGDHDLILMDILMPVMDGIETMREIRREESESGRHIPIVVVTADVARHSKSDMLAAGFDGYLSKPVGLDLLRRVLGQIADRHLAHCRDLPKGAEYVNNRP